MKCRFTTILFFSTVCMSSSARRLKEKTKKDECHTDSPCYVKNRNIVVTFTTSDAIMQNWVGIYPETEGETSDDVYRSPLHSVWGCSDCATPNQVTFQDVGLPPGTYVAQSHGIGHFGQTTFSQSKSFVVKADGEHCSENLRTSNLRAATTDSRML